MKAEENLTSEATAESLIQAHLDLKAWIEGESKRFQEFLAPYKAKMEEIDQELHKRLLALGSGDKAQLSTSAGSAYISNLMNVSISGDEGTLPYIDPESGKQTTGREALLDFSLANWDSVGNELLLFQAQKDAVKRYMEENDGRPPPGIRVGWYQRVNVRRS